MSVMALLGLPITERPILDLFVITGSGGFAGILQNPLFELVRVVIRVVKSIRPTRMEKGLMEWLRLLLSEIRMMRGHVSVGGRCGGRLSH